MQNAPQSIMLLFSFFFKKKGEHNFFFLKKVFKKFFGPPFIRGSEMEIENPKKPRSFPCELCGFITSNKKDFTRHLLTAKHTRNAFNARKAENPHHCDCGKLYKNSSGLWKHRKKCAIAMGVPYGETSGTASLPPSAAATVSDSSPTEKDLIILLLKENKEFKQMIIEQSSRMMELASKPVTVNNNCTNQQFNLSFFLNERCKNAMNMTDFVNSLQIVDADFEAIGKLGYVQGISNIFIKGLKELDETSRPVHCSDIKREVLYIKDNDTWDKDDDKQKLIKAIQDVSHKNVKYIPIWRDSHPDSMDGTTKRNAQYMRIVNQVMTSIVPDDSCGIQKIIRNVASNVCIDKY